MFILASAQSRPIAPTPCLEILSSANCCSEGSIAAPARFLAALRHLALGTALAFQPAAQPDALLIRRLESPEMLHGVPVTFALESAPNNAPLLHRKLSNRANTGCPWLFDPAYSNRRIARRWSGQKTHQNHHRVEGV
jgi:hypothetical protein